MASIDIRFSGSVPANYERYMVPLLFRPYAEMLAERARQLGGRHILETAAGTGVVTIALAEALPEAEIVATDLNQPMLDVAQALGPKLRGVMTHGSTHLRVLDDDFVLHIVAGARELLHDPQLVGVKEAAAREPGCGLAKMRVNRSGSGRGIPRTFPQPCEVFRGGRPRSSRGPNERSILPWSAS